MRGMEQRVEETRAKKVRVIFSLRLKIILTFLLVGSIVSGLLSYSVYRILDAGLLRQMQGRVLDLAKLGTHVVDVQIGRASCRERVFITV